MSWLSGLSATIKPFLSRQLAHLALRQIAKRKAEVFELVLGRAVKEIALVARRIATLPQFDPPFPRNPANIMAGGEAVGPKIAGEFYQVDELHALIA